MIFLKKLDNTLIWGFAILPMFFHGKLPFMIELSVIIFSILILKTLYKRINVPFKLNKWILISTPYIFIQLLFILNATSNISNSLILQKELIYSIYIYLLIIPVYLLNLSAKSITQRFSILYLIFISILLISFYYDFFVFGKWFGITINKSTDYNYFSLAFLSAMVIVIFNIQSSNFKSFYIPLSFFTILFSLPILLSGSRRGLVFYLLINLFLLSLFIYNFIKNKQHTNLFISAYFIQIITIVIFIFLFIYLNPVSVRIFYLQKYFKSDTEIVKSQATSIYNRYSKIYNNKSKYKDSYDDLWKAFPWEGRGILSKIIYKKELEKLYFFYKNDDFINVNNKLISLPYFSDSKSQFISDLPKEYRNLFKSDSLKEIDYSILSYTTTIPHTEINEFTLNRLDNLYIINYDSLRSMKYVIKDVNLKGREVISSYIYLLPNTTNKLEFDFQGLKKDSLEFTIKKVSGHQKDIIFQTNDNYIDSDRIKRTIEFTTGNVVLGLYRWNLIPKIYLGDTLIISEIKYQRLPNPKEQAIFVDTKLDEVNEYMSAKKNKFKLFENNYLIYKFENNNQILTKDSTKVLLDQLNKFNPQFKEYGKYSELISSLHEKKIFISPSNNIYSRAFFISPSLISGVYEIKLKVNAKKKPDIYIKRYPEDTPNFISKEVLFKKIHKSKSGIYNLEYRYKITDNASGLGALIVGIPNAITEDKFEISEVQFKFLELKDSTIRKYQYRFLTPLITESIKYRHKDKNVSKYENTTNSLDKYKAQKDFIGSRIERWKFAFYYFRQKKITNQIFGSGFEYLKIYPEIFKKEGIIKEYDYPHNPIISSFLYSGILGGFVYIYFLGFSFYRYWRLRKELALFGMLYSLTFAFTFFSGNSHFSVPAFTLLSLLPFAFPIKKVITSSNSSQKQEISSKT